VDIHVECGTGVRCPVRLVAEIWLVGIMPSLGSGVIWTHTSSRPLVEKLRIVEKASRPGLSVSYVARKYGLAPNLLFRWRKPMGAGGKVAVQADDDVVSASENRALKKRVRELERLLGRGTIEVEILKEAIEIARENITDLAHAVALRGGLPVSVGERPYESIRCSPNGATGCSWSEKLGNLMACNLISISSLPGHRLAPWADHGLAPSGEHPVNSLRRTPSSEMVKSFRKIIDDKTGRISEQCRYNRALEWHSCVLTTIKQSYQVLEKPRFRTLDSLFKRSFAHPRPLD